MSDSFRIRTAVVADAPALAALAERTFRVTFAAANDPADMEAYVRESFSEERTRHELGSAESLFLLAHPAEGEEGEAEAAPWGYAKLRTGHTDPSVTGPDPIEIERIYVDERALGRGLGARLMGACLAEAARLGHGTIWLGVWERNPRAIRFYEKWGFETVGRHGFVLGSDQQIDLVMARPVPASGADSPSTLGP